MELTAYVYYKYRLFYMPFGRKNNILILPTTVTILKNKVINNKVIINNKPIIDKPIFNYNTYEFIYKNKTIRFLTKNDFYNAINKFNEECNLLNDII